jgi:tRNA threonylcarbamoyladenosine biosynthesis protein TsaB
MAVILAVETATRVCSVAVGVDGNCIAVREETSERLSHAEKINVFAQEVLNEAGLTFQQVDAFAAGIGPGSYTGLRIGLSAVKGWCFALDRPLIGITTLQVLVQAAMRTGVPEGAILWPMVDARRMEVFTQPFSSDGRPAGTIAPLILDREWVGSSNEKRVVFGDGADKAGELWQGSELIEHLPGILPSAAMMFAVAETRYSAGEFDDLAWLVPEYGKSANVSPPRQR